MGARQVTTLVAVMRILSDQLVKDVPVLALQLLSVIPS